MRRGRFRLRIDDASDAYFFAQPAVELGGRWVGADGVQVRPHLSLGVTQFIGNATPTVDARFATGSAEVPAFRTATSLDRTHADVSARLDVLTRGSLALRAEAFGSFSSNTTTYGGGISLAMGF
ncbi:hypothetical protein CKO31_01905 [Thiohalocapsa halophila]|uniref:Autotransporter domain-containing protein n=1 Tax=Thiohalocapsa halophila TaxID=69359 RepID=A0ABS1CC90_9GAMM|nr:autotransporter domain-containing protein [Thiohalocapsa halophila]MBK1629510.1 hypothetical protein [Thiohalocapsa halophila]